MNMSGWGKNITGPRVFIMAVVIFLIVVIITGFYEVFLKNYTIVLTGILLIFIIISKKKNDASNNEVKFKTVSVFGGNGMLFQLIGGKMAREITFSNMERSIVIACETSIGADFVIIIAPDSWLGIRTECAYASNMYPGFEKSSQYLLHLEINGVISPCDLIHYKNNETGEEKYIYYEISSFFGKR